MTTGGACVTTGNLTCSGNFNTNQINGTVGIFGTNLQVNVAAAAHALLYLQGAGWYVGSMNNSQFYITDNSTGAVRIAIDTAGTVTVQQSLTVGVNFAVNGQINCGALFPASINVSGASVLNGPVNCNGLTAGPIACGTVTCTTINTQNNDITCHHISVQDGVQYANLGNHVIGFNNAGATLTFFALGGTSASWTFNTSDERDKRNIGPVIGDALTELEGLDLISYDMPLPDVPIRHFNCGFRAQNVESLIPESVTRIELPDGEERLVLDTLSLLARCVGAIQQLSAKVTTLEARLAA